MVCHETYKDQNNNWLSPDEIEFKDGKNFFIKKDPQIIKLMLDHLSQCQNQKKMLLILKI